MKYLIVSGSHKKDSQSLKVSNWLKAQLENKREEVSLISLEDNPYPMWDESAWDEGSDLEKQMEPVIRDFEGADAIVLVSPEWGGMAPAGLKNLLLYLGVEEVGHKPVMLVGVSATRGGSWPIAELRVSGYKNTKMCYIPDHLIIRNVKDVMNDESESAEEKADAYIRRRALFTLDVLGEYAKALKMVRESDKVWNDDFEYGM
jgi:NAD(P)H-dependent FMN reductase